MKKKSKIFAKVLDLFHKHLQPQTNDLNGRCIIWALIGQHVLREHGIESILQAGSASWPCKEGGRLYYKFNLAEASKWYLTKSAVSFHAWLSISETKEHVDFSIYQLKKEVAVRGDVLDIPDFLWFSGRSPYQYVPDKLAIQLMWDMIDKTIVTSPN